MKELSLGARMMTDTEGFTLHTSVVKALEFEIGELIKANGRVYKVVEITIGQGIGVISFLPAQELPGTFLGWG